MKFIISAIFFIVSLTTITFSQTPSPTPPDDVVKISTALIQIDATVTDKKGNIVKDLKPEDFEVYENGKKQTITNFSFVSPGLNNAASATTNQLSSKGTVKTNIPLPPVKLKPEQVRRTYAIVVDDLGLSFSSIFWVKDALKKFVNEQMQEDDLVAILRVGAGLGALQSFTSDKRQLLSVIEKIRWNSLANPFSYEPVREDWYDTKKDPQIKKVEKEIELKKALDRQLNMATGTLGALNYIIRGMKDLPGRKSIMFFSEGFQVIDRTRQIPKMTGILDQLRLVAETATRASVVLYTFDPRGVKAPGGQAQDDIVGLSKEGDASNYHKIGDRDLLIEDSAGSLKYLAKETGGADYSGNNLNKGIQKVFNDQSGYYLIGYQPDSESFDPKKDKFNKLEVKIKNPDLVIRYRSGFYGIADEDLKKIQAEKTPQQKIYAALSSPFGANEINLNLYSIFHNDAQNRNYIRALVHIDAKDLTFTTEPDGFYQTSFEVIGSVFDTNGMSAKNDITKTTLRFNPENYQKVLKDGVIYNLETPIIVTGGYQFRIALRDIGSNKVGAASQFIEVPELKKKNLTLSQLLVRNYPLAKWKEIISGKNLDFNTERGSFLHNTALREFKKGTVVSYHYIIYNAKWNSRLTPNLQIQTRLFQNGNLLIGNEPQPLNIGEQTDLNRIEASNVITLGNDLANGDYILQVIIIDKNADKNKQIATQWIDFSVVD